MNNPIRIQFTNGRSASRRVTLWLSSTSRRGKSLYRKRKKNVTRYVYSAAGEKLRAVHETAVPNITVPIGQTHELTSDELLFKDSTDYLLGGALVLKNGRIDKYLFDGGYCQAKEVDSHFRITPEEQDYWTLEQLDAIYEAEQNADDFSVFYYNRDHQGNVREVVDGDNGNIVQTINYYPFGMQYCDEGIDYSVQPYMYNGKEFDRVHGLNTYDYGARQYNPVTGRWDRMDPLCEKYYPTSPFAYCVNNPVRFIDLDGRELYLSGTYEEKMYLLRILQQLTNDRLDMNRKTGHVVVGAHGTKKLKNGKATLKSGTKLIAGIIADDNKMTIRKGEKTYEHDINERDASNGKGTDVKIFVSSNAITCLTENSKTKMRQQERFPSYIKLGHEIIHGYRSMKGIAKWKERKGAYFYYDESGQYWHVSGESLEEMETTGLIPAACEFSENKLRKEHGLNKRIKY